MASKGKVSITSTNFKSTAYLLSLSGALIGLDFLLLVLRSRIHPIQFNSLIAFEQLRPDQTRPVWWMSGMVDVVQSGVSLCFSASLCYGVVAQRSTLRSGRVL